MLYFIDITLYVLHLCLKSFLSVGGNTHSSVAHIIKKEVMYSIQVFSPKQIANVIDFRPVRQRDMIYFPAGSCKKTVWGFVIPVLIAGCIAYDLVVCARLITYIKQHYFPLLTCTVYG